MKKFKVFLLFLYFCEVFAGGNEFFSIIGPRSVQHGGEYVAILTSTSYRNLTELTVSLLDQKSKRLLESQTFELPITEQKIRFDLSSVKSYVNFTILAELPKRGDSYSTNFYTIERKYSVIVQTDKLIYKPGSTVNFRVLVIDKFTKPYQFESSEVVLIDANENKVKLLRFSKSKTGFYQASFRLSEDALIGKWGIHVKIDNSNEETTKNIEVKEYKLPRFEAVIATKTAILTNERTLVSTFLSRYRFGGFVKGKAKINVKTYQRKTLKNKLEREIDATSNETLSFDLANDLKITRNENAFVKISLIFEENLTKTQMKTEKNVAVTVQSAGQSQNKILLVHQEKFKPGLPYRMKVVLRDAKGKLVKSSKFKKLQVKTTYHNMPFGNCSVTPTKDSFQIGGQKSYEFNVVDAVAEFSIETFTENNALTFTFFYNGEYLRDLNVFRAFSRSREYIEAKVSRNSFSVAGKISVAVQASHDFSDLHVVVFGRSGLAFSEVHSGQDRNSYSFTFQPTPDMIPEASLFVFYYQPSGEIIFDRVILSFDKTLPNHLSIELLSDNLKPGDQAKIKLKSTKNSEVFLYAVDSSVHFMQSEYEKLRQTILSEFLQHSKIPKLDVNTKSRYPDFIESNMIVLTNAVKGFVDCSTMRAGTDAEGQRYYELEETLDIETTEGRKDFPETWLFKNIQLKNDELEVSEKLPDSITTWIISGFSLNPEAGLGFSTTKKLRVLKELFVEVEMPSKIVFGEVARIDIFVYNQKEHSRKIDVNVELSFIQNSFEILEIGKNCQKTAGNFSRKLQVDFNSAYLVSFFVRPKATGDFIVTVKATSSIGNDKVDKSLRVKQEGASHYISKTLLVDVRSKKFFSHYLTSNIESEEDVVPGSRKVGATAVGNILGSPLKLKREGSGLVKFLWGLSNLSYLKASGNLLDEKKADLVEDLSVDYQDLIKRRLADSSFGNIWTTALVAKSLADIKNWIEVDPQQTVSTLRFLDNVQLDNGAFREASDTKDNIALTAFTTIAFLDNGYYANRFNSTIKDAINFIKFSNISNNYELALSTYSMILSGSNLLLDQLSRKAIIEDDEMHWQFEFNQKRSEASKDKEMKIVIASYALLANLKGRKFEESRKILKWLMKNKGYFKSAKEAVVLQALTEAAKAFGSKNFELDIFFESDDANDQIPIHIDNVNQLHPVNIELPSVTNSVSVMANGTGIAAVDVWWKFNLKTEKIFKNFEVSVIVDPKSSKDAVKFKVCTNFIADENQTVSELAVMEVEMPSGFKFHEDSKKLIEDIDLKRFETREAKTVVLIYIENLGTESVCVDIIGLRKYEVEDMKKASVKVYDFYQKYKFGLEYYGISPLTSCNV